MEAALGRIEAGTDPAAFARGLTDPRRGARLLARLIEEVTVKETSFLRDHGQLASIDWPLLLSRAHARGNARVRVWTAACATGEEAYSLALLASEAFGAERPPVSILATDISPDALARARVGSYRARSVRDLGPEMRARHLRADGEQLVVGERLREVVTFARHNLVRDPFPPLGEAPFDLILCRNVLIYFDAATVGRVLTSLEQALASTGTLVLGAADALCATAARMADAGTPAAAAAHRPARELRRPLGRLAPPIASQNPTKRPPTSGAASRRSSATTRPRRWRRCAGRSSPSRTSASRRSSSAPRTRRSAIRRRRGAPITRRCGRSSRTSATSRSWARSTLPTWPRRRGRGSTCWPSEPRPGAPESYGSKPGANGSVPSASETPLKALFAFM